MNLFEQNKKNFFSKNSKFLGKLLQTSKLTLGAALVSASVNTAANADWVLGTTNANNANDNVLVSADDAIDGAVTFKNNNAAVSIDITGGEAIDSLTLETDADVVTTLTLDTAGAAVAADNFAISGDVTVAAGDTLIIKLESGKYTSAGDSVEVGNGILSYQMQDATTMEFTGTETHDGIINGLAAGEGTLKISGASTFAEAIGAANSLEAIDVDAATTFSVGIEAETATIDADTTVTADSELGAATVTDSTLTFLADVTDVDGAVGVAEITLANSTSTGTLNIETAAAAETMSMKVIAGADGQGAITINSNAGNAPNETIVSSTIGADLVRVGSITIGTSAIGGNADFEGATFTDALTIEGGNAAAEDSILDMGATLSSTNGITLTTAGDGDAELNVTAAVTVTGAIDASGSGAGSAIIDIDENVTFGSAIGATTAVTTIELVTGKTATFQGNVSATTATLAGTGNATFDAGAAQTFTGTIAAAVDGEGTVTNANTDGEVTFDGAIGTENLRMLSIVAADGAITSFNNAIFAETLDINGNASGEDITLEAAGNIIGTDADGGVANAGALDFAGGNNIELGTAIGSGSVVFDVKETAAAVGGVVIGGDITVKPSANFTSGTITFIDGDFNAISNDEQARVLVQDTALTDFTVTAGAQDVTITATAKSDTTTASELSVTTNNATSLRQAIEAANSGSTADSGALTALNDSLVVINGRSATDDTDLAKQLAPQDDMISGSTFATKAMTGSLQGIMSNRMAALRSGDAYYGSGMSAGSLSKNSGFIQVFGSDVEQKNKTVGSGTQFGYDASTAGVAIGLDGITDGGSVVGFSLSTSQSDVDGKGTGNSKNDIDSYTASIYMDKSTDAGYIEGSLTIGMNENSTSRIVNAAGLDRTYKGDYDSYQASLNLSGGVPNDTGNGFVTPFGGVSATQIQTERYRETSSVANDSLRLTVDQDDTTSIVGTLGVKYHNVLDNGGVPMISLAVNNEFGDNTIESTNTFQGGGTSFKTSTDVEELSATLALGYAFSSDNTTLELSYEADANDDDYLSHYGSIKIVGKF